MTGNDEEWLRAFYERLTELRQDIQRCTQELEDAIHPDERWKIRQRLASLHQDLIVHESELKRNHPEAEVKIH